MTGWYVYLDLVAEYTGIVVFQGCCFAIHSSTPSSPSAYQVLVSTYHDLAHEVEKATVFVLPQLVIAVLGGCTATLLLSITRLCPRRSHRVNVEQPSRPSWLSSVGSAIDPGGAAN